LGKSPVWGLIPSWPGDASGSAQDDSCKVGGQLIRSMQGYGNDSIKNGPFGELPHPHYSWRIFHAKVLSFRRRHSERKYFSDDLADIPR